MRPCTCRVSAVGFVVARLLPTGCGVQENSTTSRMGVPPAYAEKQMPNGWWADPSITEQGRLLYLGVPNRDVNCAKCHGRTGKPVKAGARDFRDATAMKKHSDAFLFWRIAEGISFTQMRGYKETLTEEEIWKATAFISTVGLTGLQYDVNSGEWVPVGPKPSSASEFENTEADSLTESSHPKAGGWYGRPTHEVLRKAV